MLLIARTTLELLQVIIINNNRHDLSGDIKGGVWTPTSVSPRCQFVPNVKSSVIQKNNFGQAGGQAGGL